MSKQIDERIVEMRFENSKFEKNVATTMKSLDKLKEKLAFKNAEDGFKNIEKASKSLSFEHLVKTIDDLNEKVASRGNVLTKVVDNIKEKIASSITEIESKIVNMVKQVTIDPISTGMSEYELKTNSIQVIAANTGVLMNDAMEQMGKSAETVTDTFDAMEIAWDVLQGKYGDGAERMEALGDKYEQVQYLVNQLASGEIKMGENISVATEALEEQVYTMADIEHVLDDLNTYADKTIYNYAQMTDAIGQFTVQGVDLYDAATAVQGMANLAAFTGSDAATTARVMREAAKGLATGYINLQDWMSFETAGGMGGKEFQEQLMATADKLWETDEAYREYVMNATMNANGLATVVDYSTESISEWINEQGRFRDSLKGGWLNDTVLIETLHKFAGDLTDAEYAARGYTEAEIADIQALGQVAFEAATKSKTFTQMWDAVTEAAQSSWTTTWEYIFGHFYDARNLWTAIGDELSNIIGSMNEARNTALKFWATNPLGRERTLKGIANVWRYLTNIVSALSIEWRSAFKQIDGRTLVILSNNFYKFSQKLHGQEINYQIGIIANTFGIFVDILEHAVKIAKSAGGVLKNFFTGIFGSIDTQNLYFAVLNIREFVNTLLDVSSLDTRISDFLTTLLTPLYNLLANIDIDRLANDFMYGMEIIVSAFGLLIKVAKAVGITIGTVLTYILNMFGISFTMDNVEDILMIADALVSLGDSMIDLEAIPGRVTTALDKFFTFIKNIPLYIVGGAILLNETIKEFTGIDILGIFGTIFNNIKSLVTDIGTKITEFIEKFKNAEIIGDKIKVILAGIGSVIKTLFSGVLDFAGPIGVKLKEFIGTLVDKNNIQRLTQLAVLAARMYLLLKVISSTKVITAIAEGVKEFVKVVVEGSKGAFDAATEMFSAISKSSNAQLIFSIASAILALAIALKVISTIPSEKMEDVLITFIILFGGMLALFGGLKKMLGGLPEKAAAEVGSVLIGIGVALFGIALAVKIISKIGYEDLAKAVVAIAVIIGALSVLVKAFAHTKRAKYAVGVAVSINILMQALFPLIAALGAIMFLLEHSAYKGEVWDAVAVLGVLIIFVGALVVFSTVMSGLITSKKALAGLFVIGNTVQGLAFAIIMMVGSLYLIMKIIQSATRDDEVGDALNILAWLVIFLAGLVAVVMTFAKFLTPSSVAGLAVVGGTMVGLEIAILAMVGILYLIMKIMGKATREGEVGEALEILIILMITLAGFTALLMGFSSILTPASVGGLLVIGLTMLMFAGAITIMLKAFSEIMVTLKEINMTVENGRQAWLYSLGTFFGICVVLLIAMAGLIAGATIIPPGGALKIAAIGLVLLALAKGTDIIVDALKKLMDINYDDKNFASAMRILGAIVLALVVIAVVMGLIFGNAKILSNNRFNFSFNPFLMFGNSMGGTNGVSKIGTLLAGIGIAILAVIAAIWIILDAFAKLIDLSNKWDSENGKDKVLKVITDFCQIFVDAKPAIESAASSFNDMLIDFLLALVNDILTLLKALIDFLVDGVKYLANGLVDILLGVVAGLAGSDLSDAWSKIMDASSVEDMFVEFMKTAQNAPINKLINAVVAFIALFIYGVGDAIINNAGPLAIAIGYLIVALGYLEYYILGLILQAFLPEIDIDAMNEYFSDFGKNFVDGWTTTWNTTILPHLQKLGEKIKSGLLWLFGSVIYAPLKAITNAANEWIGTINNALGYDMLETWDTSSLDSWYGELLKNAGMIENENEKAASSIDSMSESMKNFNNTIDNLTGKDKNVTIKFGAEYSENDTDKLADGLYSATKKAGESSVKGFKEAWDIHSPSGVGEDAGEDIGAGVINGIVGYYNSTAAKEKLTALKDAIPKINFSDLYDPESSQFSIEPSQVFNLDTENMGDDLLKGNFGNLFSGMGTDIGTVSTDLATVNTSTQAISDALTNDGGKFYDDTDVVNELSGLRDDISMLSSAMAQIKMYLDTNVLVGELVAPLDNKLAQRATRARRGN